MTLTKRLQYNAWYLWQLLFCRRQIHLKWWRTLTNVFQIQVFSNDIFKQNSPDFLCRPSLIDKLARQWRKCEAAVPNEICCQRSFNMNRNLTMHKKKLPAIILNYTFIVQTRDQIERIHRDEHIANVCVNNIFHETFAKIIDTFHWINEQWHCYKQAITSLHVWYIDTRNKRHVIKTFLTQFIVPFWLSVCLL